MLTSGIRGMCVYVSFCKASEKAERIGSQIKRSGRVHKSMHPAISGYPIRSLPPESKLALALVLDDITTPRFPSRRLSKLHNSNGRLPKQHKRFALAPYLDRESPSHWHLLRASSGCEPSTNGPPLQAGQPKSSPDPPNASHSRAASRTSCVLVVRVNNPDVR